MSHAWFLSVPLIGCAALIDLLMGDPAWLPHPVQAIGVMITRGEQALRSGRPAGDLRNGFILAALVIGISAFSTWALVRVADGIAFWLGAILATLAAALTIANRGLDDAALTIQQALAANRDDDARAAIPSLAGRDPASLGRSGMIRATIESLAENASDGIVAPLLFLFVAGPVGAIAYKAINTLDSMLGYRDERYLDFGRAAARLDDFANWVPARITALCIAGASHIALGAGRRSLAVIQCDARSHESPNAGFPEAAMAGALGIELGGDAVYGGEVVRRSKIGTPAHPVSVEHIALARRIVKFAVVIAFVLFGIGRYALMRL
ncbi:MAG: adenosylcobinamide-phosphate synthase CbiB [Candidatus Binataceae bacterium]